MLCKFIGYMRDMDLVEYIPRTTIVDVERRGAGCVAKDSAGASYEADHIFMCVGVNICSLLPEVFSESELQLCKLQMMRTIPQPDFHLAHSVLSGLSIRRYPAFRTCPSFDLMAKEPVPDDLSANGIHVLMKQTADGSIILGDSHEYRDWYGSEELLERTDPSINASILRHAQTILSLPLWQIASLWNGYYLVHPSDPVFVQTVEDYIHVVTGIGGKGMTTGPGFARHCVETVLA